MIGKMGKRQGMSHLQPGNTCLLVEDHHNHTAYLGIMQLPVILSSV